MYQNVLLTGALLFLYIYVFFHILLLNNFSTSDSKTMKMVMLISAVVDKQGKEIISPGGM